MAPRKAKPQQVEKISTQLIVGKDYFKKVLEERIASGEEILNRQIQTKPQLEVAKKTTMIGMIIIQSY